MAACETLVSMGHERKVENLRAYMVNLANSRSLPLPKNKLFEQKFLDLCLSHTPDHPAYSAMIFIAIEDLNEEGGSCEEAISEFIKSKYKTLPFAHTSLLSHHLAKLVEKREIFCDYTNYCYSLSGSGVKNTVASTDTGKKSAVITNDQRAVDEVMTHRNEEESVKSLKSGNQKVDMLEDQSVTESRTSPQSKTCCVIEVRHTDDKVVEAGLRNSTVESPRNEEVAEEPVVALDCRETQGGIEANNEGGLLCELVLLDEQDDMRRTSNTMKEPCVEVKSEAYKRRLESQIEASNNIIALEKMLKQCREKDQQNKAVSEIDDGLPLSMESCKELWKVAQKVQSQLSEIIDSSEEAVVPYSESRGCEIKGISTGLFKEDPKMKTPCGNNGSEKTSKQLEQKERENGSQTKSQVKKTRIKRLRDIGTTVVRKSPRFIRK